MKHLCQYFHTVCICFSAFYRPKLFSWILTLVNFASDRNKTLFSGGTRREAWETHPLIFRSNKGPQGQAVSLTPPPPPHPKHTHLISGPYDLGPLLSNLLLCLLWFPILYSISDLLDKEFCVDHCT